MTQATPQPPLQSVPLSPEIVRGVAELEPSARGLVPHRLPAWARAQVPDPQLLMAEGQPSGARIAFRSTATVIELDVLATKRLYPGLPPRPDGVLDLIVDGRLVDQARVTEGDTITIDLATGTSETTRGPVATVRFEGLDPRDKSVELWLPHLETTELVDLRTDAPVEALGDRGRRTWVHHGSSISQGSGADRPTSTWPALAARLGGVDLVNLGLAGSALLDPAVGRVLRDTSADLLSIKMGINVVNADLMRRRAFGPALHGLLDTVRDGHPDIPLLVVTPLHCAIHEDTPGPGAFDLEALAEGRLGFRATGDPADVAAGRLTLGVVREEMARVVAQRSATDRNLHLLDGLSLYGADDAIRLPLPDGLHPDDATHRLVGDRFAGHAFAPAGPFADRS
jgi:hypothetical protein